MFFVGVSDNFDDDLDLVFKVTVHVILQNQLVTGIYI